MKNLPYIKAEWDTEAKADSLSDPYFVYAGIVPPKGSPLPFALSGLDVCPPFIENDFDAAWDAELGDDENPQEVAFSPVSSVDVGFQAMVNALKATAWRWGVDLHELAWLLGVDVYRTGDNEYVGLVQGSDEEMEMVTHSIHAASDAMKVGTANLNARIAEVYGCEEDADEEEQEEAAQRISEVFMGNSGSGTTLYAEAEAQAARWREENQETDNAETWEIPNKERGVPFPISLSMFRESDKCELAMLRRDIQFFDHYLDSYDSSLRAAYVRAMITLADDWTNSVDGDERGALELQALYLASEYQEMMTGYFSEKWNRFVVNKKSAPYLEVLRRALKVYYPRFQKVLTSRLDENLDVEFDAMLERTLSLGDEWNAQEEVVAAPYLSAFEEELATQAIVHAQVIHSYVQPAARSLAFQAGFDSAAEQGIPYGECLLSGFYAHMVDNGYEGTFLEFWERGKTEVHSKAKDGHTTINFGKLLKRMGEIVRSFPREKWLWMMYMNAKQPLEQGKPLYRAVGRAIRYAQAQGDHELASAIYDKGHQPAPARPFSIRLSVDPNYTFDSDNAPTPAEVFWTALAQAGAEITDDVVWVTRDVTILHMADEYGHAVTQKNEMIPGRHLNVGVSGANQVRAGLVHPAFASWTTQSKAVILAV